MFSRQTVLAVLAASAALLSADAFAPAAPIALSVSFTCRRQTRSSSNSPATLNVCIKKHQRKGMGSTGRVEENYDTGSTQDMCSAKLDLLGARSSEVLA